MNSNTLDLTGRDVFIGDLDCGSTTDTHVVAVIDLRNINLMPHMAINLGTIP